MSIKKKSLKNKRIHFLSIMTSEEMGTNNP